MPSNICTAPPYKYKLPSHDLWKRVSQKEVRIMRDRERIDVRHQTGIAWTLDVSSSNNSNGLFFFFTHTHTHTHTRTCTHNTARKKRKIYYYIKICKKFIVYSYKKIYSKLYAININQFIWSPKTKKSKLHVFLIERSDFLSCIISRMIYCNGNPIFF